MSDPIVPVLPTVSIHLPQPDAGTLLDDRPLVFARGRNYLELPRDPQPWVVRGVLPVGGLVNIMGKPKLGKSFLGLGLACAVSDPTVKQWMGFDVLKHGTVVYIQIDTPRGFWAERIERLVQAGHNVDNIEWCDALMAPYPFDVMQMGLVHQLREKIAELKPIMVVFDTLREIHQMDENDSTAMKKVLTNVVYTARGTNATIVFISHTRKEQSIFGGKGKAGGGGQPDDLMNDGRGTSYVPGRMDVMMKLSEKRLVLKGRGLKETLVAVEQDETGMIVPDREKAAQEAKIKKVLGVGGLSRADQDKLLAEMENITVAAAKTQITRFKRKLGGGDSDDNSSEGDE